MNRNNEIEPNENQTNATVCDLIRDYLTRNRVPPPIFQMSDQRQLINMAYRHPQLLVDDQNDDDNDEINNDRCAAMAYDQRTQMNRQRYDDMDETCKLIGNVKPNLVRTWEQLNCKRTNQNQSDQIIEYPRDYDGKGLNESFTICENVSERFYDSIDNASVSTRNEDDELIASLCDQMAAGGETMAEYISLMNRKEEICWSIDGVN